MTLAYYNEFDPYAAAWLRNLISAGHLPAGDVDERSIVDVAPADLAGYAQCHFFAGIGGWALAARLAGWPDDRELWTGSAPCQPFSVAGQQRGTDDDRHLWPHLFRLARARRPAVLMGEQVAAAVGKDWLDGIATDLESIGYACGAAVVPACAVNAPHRRDRLWFVAHTDDARLQGFSGDVAGAEARRCVADGSVATTGVRDHACAVGDTDGLGGQVDSNAGRCADGSGSREIARSGCAGDSAMVDTDIARASEERQQRSGQLGGSCGYPSARAGGHWDDFRWITGHDGKARRVEPGIRLLAHGLHARVGRLRAYGNAICVPLAAEIVAAYMDCRP